MNVGLGKNFVKISVENLGLNIASAQHENGHRQNKFTKFTLSSTVHQLYTRNTPGSIKASELVPCSLLPHWNSMRFFGTVSLSDMNSLQEVKFATLHRQSSNTLRIL